MSFALTTPQVRNQSKSVTRRVGWKFLKAGDLLCACVKCQGLRPGEKLERLATIRVISARRERLKEITREDVAKEGFPLLSKAEFVKMFCDHMKCTPETIVTRIEFEYVDETVEVA